MFVIIVKYLNGVYFLKIIPEFISEQILIKIWVAYFCSTKMWDVVSNKDASFKKKNTDIKMRPHSHDLCELIKHQGNISECIS